jgi:hypothetical protein
MEYENPLRGPCWLAGTVALKGAVCVRQIFPGRSDVDRLDSVGSEWVVGRASLVGLPVRCGRCEFGTVEICTGRQGSCRFGTRWAGNRACCWSAITGHVALPLSRRCSSDWTGNW